MSEFTSINPYDNQAFARYEGFDLGSLDTVLAGVQQAQLSWAARAHDSRADLLRDIAATLRKRSDSLAELATLEMGKTLASSRAEVEKCAWVCEYYADNGPRLLQDREIETSYSKSFTSLQPLGVLLAIMPWNFPYWQVFRFLAPALMAGNAVILKHASNVPGCALAMEKLLVEAGAPPQLFRSLLVSSRESAALIGHPLVQGVTFTGSTGAGRKIAAQAGEHLRKTVLELGGSDPYVVMADADLDKAVATCVTSRLINNGQSCIAAKRFIVHDSLHDEFVAGMARAFSSKKLGDPLQAGTDIGPMARADLCDDLDDQVSRSLKQGACLVTGGRADKCLYRPTVLADVTPGMAAFDEELFGPVAAIVRAGSDEEAIDMANQSEFGLGAAVFTRDTARGEALARSSLNAGACFVNAFVASDPRLPFGGIKASGYGRELGEIGIGEFCNLKTVVIG